MLLFAQNNATAAVGSRRINLPNLVLMQQPQYAAQIAWSNSLTRGLVGFWHSGDGTFRSITPSSLGSVLSAGGGYGITQKGRTVRATGPTVQTAYIPHDSRYLPTNAITILGEGVVVSSSAAGSNYWFGKEDATGGFGVYGNPDGAVHPYLKVGTAFADQSSGVALGTAAQVGMTFDGSTFATVGNGKQFATQAISGTITHASVGMALTARGDGDAGNKGDGSFYYFAIWNRALSARELADFYANPWQVLR